VEMSRASVATDSAHLNRAPVDPAGDDYALADAVLVEVQRELRAGCSTPRTKSRSRLALSRWLLCADGINSAYKRKHAGRFATIFRLKPRTVRAQGRASHREASLGRCCRTRPAPRICREPREPATEDFSRALVGGEGGQVAARAAS
jgi:hypothetical protein